MNLDLQSLGITQADLRLLLLLSQAACAVLAAGLFLNWIKGRHPGVLLSCGLYGSGTYFSFTHNEWWPLAAALAAAFVLKSMGFHMGYH
jgi:hypothetical protein